MKEKYLNPYLAGFLLGLVLLCAIFLTGRGLGASGAYKSFVIASVKAVAPAHAGQGRFYLAASSQSSNPLKAWLVFEVLGVLLGAFASGVVAGRLTWETERPPGVASRRRLVAALGGGVLFGFGAMLARGCTSGAALSGLAVLSAGGLLTMAAIFGSAYAAAYFFRKLWYWP